MPAEGTLFKGKFGGDIAHTSDHPVIIRNAVLTATADIPPGTLLKENGDGTVSAYQDSGVILGVAEFGANVSDTTISYVAHGTVKQNMLKLADGSVFTKFADLHKINIYEV